MAIGTLTAILLGAAALGGTAALTSSQNKKAEKEAQQKIDKVKQEAEQKALTEQQGEEKTQKARASLLAAPTSGFGPNTNLARSFLTTL